MTRMNPRLRRAMLFCRAPETRESQAARIQTDADHARSRGRGCYLKAGRGRHSSGAREIDFGSEERCVESTAARRRLSGRDIMALRPLIGAPGQRDTAEDRICQTLRWLKRRASRDQRVERISLAEDDQVLALIRVRGLVDARDRKASPRLDALVLGAEDLCGDIGALRCRLTQIAVITLFPRACCQPSIAWAIGFPSSI